MLGWPLPPAPDGRAEDEIEAEDLLQDVFYELVEAYRLMKPVAHTGAWMMQVAVGFTMEVFNHMQTMGH